MTSINMRSAKGYPKCDSRLVSAMFVYFKTWITHLALIWENSRLEILDLNSTVF